MSWILSRRRNLSDTLMAEVGHVIDSLCLNEAQFYTTIQTLGKHVLEPLIVYNTTVIIIFQNKTANFFLMYSANTDNFFFQEKQFIQYSQSLIILKTTNKVSMYYASN